MDKLDEIESLIDAIRKRPGVYFGRYSVTRLAMFLCGYDCAVSNCGNNSIGVAILQFRNWLASQYSEKSMFGWEEILLMQTNNDEKLALDLFWKKWDEFCEEK